MYENKYWTQEEIEKYLKELGEYNRNKEAKIDMHNHTQGSDGEDSPLMLLLRAHNMGLETISFTDHNSVKGYSILQEQIEKLLTYLEEINSRTDLNKE